MFNLLMAPMDIDLTIERIKPIKKSSSEDKTKKDFFTRHNLFTRKENTSSMSDKHLRNLGFVKGAKISIVNEIDGNVIVKIKDSKIAIDRDLAKKIMVKH